MTARAVTIRARGRGVPPDTMSMSPGYFVVKKKKDMRPKELPGCSIPT